MLRRIDKLLAEDGKEVAKLRGGTKVEGGLGVNLDEIRTNLAQARAALAAARLEANASRTQDGRSLTIVCSDALERLEKAIHLVNQYKRRK